MKVTRTFGVAISTVNQVLYEYGLGDLQSYRDYQLVERSRERDSIMETISESLSLAPSRKTGPDRSLSGIESNM